MRIGGMGSMTKEMQKDSYNLQRFVEAQEEMYAVALKEIKQAGKYNHWMWFIFPQIAGLGSSYYAQKYSISSLDEARAYISHPVLGARLLECAEAVLALSADVCPDFFGYIDSMKLCSSMTLFAEAVPEHSVFQKILDKFYNGKSDLKTISLL